MLVHQIREDMETAMRARDDLRVQTLRGALAAFTNELVAKSMKPTDEVTDAMAAAVLKRLAKQRKDSAEQFAKGGRQELADKESAELEIIESYLPRGVSLEEIEKVAKAKMAELGVSDAAGLGKLTGAVMKEFTLAGQGLAGRAGHVDGNDVREILKRLLS